MRRSLALTVSDTASETFLIEERLLSGLFSRSQRNPSLYAAKGVFICFMWIFYHCKKFLFTMYVILALL